MSMSHHTQCQDCCLITLQCLSCLCTFQYVAENQLRISFKGKAYSTSSSFKEVSTHPFSGRLITEILIYALLWPTHIFHYTYKQSCRKFVCKRCSLSEHTSTITTISRQTRVDKVMALHTTPPIRHPTYTTVHS